MIQFSMYWEMLKPCSTDAKMSVVIDVANLGCYLILLNSRFNIMTAAMTKKILTRFNHFKVGAVTA
jgi:hypothetical protein